MPREPVSRFGQAIGSGRVPPLGLGPPSWAPAHAARSRRSESTRRWPAAKYSQFHDMTLRTLQHVEPHLSSAEQILLTEELCDSTLRQLREHLRSALQAATTERIRIEVHATRDDATARSITTATAYRHLSPIEVRMPLG